MGDSAQQDQDDRRFPVAVSGGIIAGESATAPAPGAPSPIRPEQWRRARLPLFTTITDQRGESA
jgi:hypothetical protein